MKITLTIEEAMQRASGRLRKKMAYSIDLLRKGERIALSYDRRGGITWLFLAEKTVRPSITCLSWLAYSSRDT